MKRNNIIVFLLLSVLCAILMISSSIEGSWLSPVRSFFGYALSPLQTSISTVSVSLYNKIKNTEELKNAQIKCDELQDTVDALIEKNTQLELENAELERLRQLLELSNEYGHYHSVAARVIAKDSAGWFEVFRIDKGSEDGIKVDMNVIADGGLVGIVTDVGPNYSTVKSIIDSSSNISSMSVRTNEYLFVSGDIQAYEQGKLVINKININADIKEGDKIVTSNISSKFLPGILIGYVTDIGVDSNELTKSGYIIPVAGFDSLQEVLVITDLKFEE